jgi:hypothetical protein
MKCMICGGPMSVIAVESHETIELAGFGYRIWKCGECGEAERRTVFDPHMQPSNFRPASPQPESPQNLGVGDALVKKED